MCVFDQKPMHFEDLPLSSIHVEKLGAKLIVLKATEEGGGAEENPSAHSILKKKKICLNSASSRTQILSKTATA